MKLTDGTNPISSFENSFTGGTAQTFANNAGNTLQTGNTSSESSNLFNNMINQANESANNQMKLTIATQQNQDKNALVSAWAAQNQAIDKDGIDQAKKMSDVVL